MPDRTSEERYLATVAELQMLARNAPHIKLADILEIASMPVEELRRRAIRQRDWAGHWSHCLDGLDVWQLPGAAPDGCWMPREVRSVVEQLLTRTRGVKELPGGRNSQHVLKAEGERPDATDRENCANASPDGGPMGAGQAAAAAPADGVALPRADQQENTR
jgi:hypothetical protein